jgi:putative transposase
MIFTFIEEHRDVWPVRLLCDALDVSPAGYYAWRGRPASERQQVQDALLVEIRAIHAEFKARYGSPRVHAELAARGHDCCVNTVARLMRDSGIQAKTARKFRGTTDSNHDLPVAENLLGRQFDPECPNEAWVADITYIPTREGWLYLAAILDLYSRAVVGWAMGNKLGTQLVIDALQMAIHQRGVGPKILHSDQGCTYSADDYREILDEHRIRQSMSRKGDCWDNAPMESFFHTLKTELVMHCDYRTRDQARASLFDYVEMFYNRQRRHSTINYEAPLEFEAARAAS